MAFECLIIECEQSVPQSFLVAHELMGMTLEYRRECTHSDVLSSLTAPDNPNDLADHHLDIHAIHSNAAAPDHDHHRQGNSNATIIDRSNYIPLDHSIDRDHDHRSRTISPSSIDHLHVINGSKSGAAHDAHAATEDRKPSMIHFTHLLRLEDKMTEILRGRTSWRLKKQHR
jgi:hypothetical protein